MTAVTPEPGLVVSVGRIERYKGHHKAIEALPYLLKTRPEARVEILGAGPYEAELLALAEELGVADRVTIRFIPPVDRALMGECIARAGVMTLLSDYEAHPVAVMEALDRRAARRGQPDVGAHRARRPRLGGGCGPARERRGDRSRPSNDSSTTPSCPDPADLPTWETCVAGVVDTYDSITSR